MGFSICKHQVEAPQSAATPHPCQDMMVKNLYIFYIIFINININLFASLSVCLILWEGNG